MGNPRNVLRLSSGSFDLFRYRLESCREQHIRPTQSTLLANAKEKVGSYPQIACSVVSNKLYLRGVRYCFTRAKPNPPTALQDCPSQMDAVCTSVPAAQRNVIFPPTPVSDSGHRVTGELLASA
ncbi:hypothetical protein V6N12_063328 [Hibiscus sabdariffa]|uniref:Uncharacterized protein n=1 Tax=Hibiscus sabdariffa TaxID=183260 RepID=A0ABR2FBE1_9ROSI